MKFRANHDVVIGKPPATRTVAGGELLPKLPVDELQRLVELGAATGIDEPKAASEPAPADDDKA